MDVNNHWNCCATIAEGEQYSIDGLNIWGYKWINTGEYFIIKEPARQIDYKVSVYEINFEGKQVRFGATEVSNSAWTIYTSGN